MRVLNGKDVYKSKDFQTEKEADVHLSEHLESKENEFCPLINAECNPSCVCFQPAKVTASSLLGGSDRFYVHGGYCMNQMFFNTDNM